MEEIIIETKEWTAPEYTHNPRDNDWMWAVGLIALVGAGIALWFSNYLFMLFILMSGVVLIMFSIRPPRNVNFEINQEGIKTGAELHPYKIIKGFAIKNGVPYDTLLVETNKYFLPTLAIPIPVNMTDEIKNSLSRIMPMLDLEESKAMIFMEKLGF